MNENNVNFMNYLTNKAHIFDFPRELEKSKDK